MDNPLTVSLAVSGIGMLILFLALAFLCGLMYLMTAYIHDRPRAIDHTAQIEEEETSRKEQQRRISEHLVAATAVALARAERDTDLAGAQNVPDANSISVWWTLHHQRQLTLNAPTRKAR